MEKLTERQERILLYIQEYQKDHGFPPTVREISSYVGCCVSVVFNELSRLEGKGYIKKDVEKCRNITILGESRQNTNIPLVKTVKSEKEIMDAENIEKYVPFPSDKRNDNKYFSCRMEGSFLCEQGIYDGDILCFELREDAEEGSIVAALVKEHPVIGIFANDRILPANKSMQPVISDKIKIIGILRYSTREY